MLLVGQFELYNAHVLKVSWSMIKTRQTKWDIYVISPSIIDEDPAESFCARPTLFHNKATRGEDTSSAILTQILIIFLLEHVIPVILWVVHCLRCDITYVLSTVSVVDLMVQS